MAPAFEHLLNEIRTLHETDSLVGDFVSFATDLRPIDHSPRHLPCADHFLSEPIFKHAQLPLAKAFYDAAPDAHWLEPYSSNMIGEDFVQRFGCYCVIGESGAWLSDELSAYVVAMPAGLHYPWHHHPAEEMYYVLAGEGIFMREGEPDEVLKPGGCVVHASNQPHALETTHQPIMAYVLWRNHLKDKPVLTERPISAIF